MIPSPSKFSDTSAWPSIISRILEKRGLISLEKQRAFLFPDYVADLHDPFLLQDMEAAVARVILALERSEDIVIYGDYDIDGITASAVMIEALSQMGGRARSYIPDRFEEGYGINLEALQLLKKQGAQLIISVDCGITSVKEVAWAREHNLDIIITDHHAVPEIIPDAVAVVNPKRPNDKYPFKDLAGVGVAFKLVQALQQRLGLPLPGQEKWLLDLVALGTVCDVVTLVGENRTLVRYGLQVMRKTRRAGLRALAEVSGVELAQLRSYHLGFVFGPRMNAAGRLEHAAQSLELMLTGDRARAGEIARELDGLNLDRRAQQAKIVLEASEMAADFKDDAILVLASPAWSHGIVGIAASKLVEQWQRPVLVMQIMGETAKGSARSMAGFNLVEAFRRMPQHFVKFGGHHFAAGYTLKTAEIEPLRKSLQAYAAARPKLLIADAEVEHDAVVEELSLLSWDLLAALELLEPFGNGNTQPVFRGQATISGAKKIGKESTHYRLVFKDTAGNSLAGVGFNLVKRYPDLKEGQQVGFEGTLVRNDFNGQSTLQLNVIKIYE